MTTPLNGSQQREWHITERYRLIGDSTCWTLSELMQPTAKSKSGEAYWKPVAYHGNLKDMVACIVERRLRTEGFADLEEAVRKIERLKAEIAVMLAAQIPERGKG